VTARCPECQARYKIERERIGPRGARLRCTRCDTIFRVHAPGAPDEAVAAEREPEPPARDVAPAAPPPPRPAPAPERTPRARALVAEADAAVAKEIGAFLTHWQLEAELVHDGREALLRLFRQPPALVILGGRLPRVEAPLVCEVARRARPRGAPRMIRIVSLDEPVGAPEFEADATLEPGDLPGGLGPLLERLGLGVRPSAPAPPPPVAKPAPPRSSPAAAAPSAAPAAPAANDPGMVNALRLARIIVSDIVLYNEDKFAAAAATGTAGKALEAELAEARAMFNTRVPEAVRAGRDLLVEELERRAAARKVG
jgi:predicted Zn finger-like uncharacterized protein